MFDYLTLFQAISLDLDTLVEGNLHQLWEMGDKFADDEVNILLHPRLNAVE